MAFRLSLTPIRAQSLLDRRKIVRDTCDKGVQGRERTANEQKRQLVELLIDRVVMTNEEVEIRYVIPTSVRSEQIRFCHLLTGYFMTVYVILSHVRMKYVKKSRWSMSHRLFFLHLFFYFLPERLPATLYRLNGCQCLLIILW